MGSSSPSKGEHKKCLKPPPRCLCWCYHLKIARTHRVWGRSWNIPCRVHFFRFFCRCFTKGRHLCIPLSRLGPLSLSPLESCRRATRRNFRKNRALFRAQKTGGCAYSVYIIAPSISDGPIWKYGNCKFQGRYWKNMCLARLYLL